VTKVRAQIQDQLRRIQDAFTDAMLAGVRDGSVRGDIDPDFESREIMHSGIGATCRWIIDTDNFDFSAYLSQWRTSVHRRLEPRDTAT
jgi:hypothetical protein